MRAIDADAFSDWLKEYGQEYIHGKKKISLMYIWKHVQDMPTIVPERKHGRWIEEDDGWDNIIWRCSECGELYCLIDDTPKENNYHFCPNCGADMTEEEQ